MAVSVQERTRRRRYRRSRLFTIVLILGIITSAVILIVQPRQAQGAQQNAPGAADNIQETLVDLDAVQNKLETLDWVGQDLLPLNEYSRPGTELKEVNAIVIHYVGNPRTTAKQNRSYYGKLADTHETSASSNFLVGLDGEIIQCVPVSEVAYCSNWRNDDTISIECCHPDVTGRFTDDTYDALVRLTAWLCSQLQLNSSDLLRHYDVTGKECPIYFVENPEAWASFKDDVRSALEDISTSEASG